MEKGGKNLKIHEKLSCLFKVILLELSEVKILTKDRLKPY